MTSVADINVCMKSVCVLGVRDCTSPFRRRKGLRKSALESFAPCHRRIALTHSHAGLSFSWRGSIRSQGIWLHAYLRFSSCCLPSRRGTQSASLAISSRPPLGIQPASRTARRQMCGLGQSPLVPSLSFASSTRSYLKRASGLATFLAASSWFCCSWSSAQALPP